MSEIKDFLKSIEMFIGLTDDMLDQVAGFCQLETYDSGQVIVERNSPADDFYLIREGTVEILATVDAQKDDSRKGVVVTLGKGQSFGEMSLIDSGSRSATVVAATPVSLYAVSCAKFRNLCETNTDVGYNVMRNIATDLSFKLRYRNLI